MIRNKNFTQKYPKGDNLEKMEGLVSWLKITEVCGEKKICKVCTGQEEKLKLMPSASLTFINGSTNFKMSSLSDHATTDGHTHAIREQENNKILQLVLPSHFVRLFRKHQPILQLVLVLKEWEKPKRQR